MGGIVSSLVGDIFGGSKKQKANTKATNAELAAQQQVRDTITGNRNQLDSQIAPYYNSGTVGLNTLTNDIANGSLYKPFSTADFQADPGYQFRIQQGQKAIDANASRAGSVFSGGQLKAAAGYNQDAASQEYQSAYDRYTGDQTRQYNMLSGLANIGQNALGQRINTDNAATQGLVTSLGTSGQAQAQGYVNQGTIAANTINNVVKDGNSLVTSLASIFG